MKIAEGLLLRKQLEAKVKQLEPLKLQGENGVFEMQTKRININENVDEVSLKIPRVELSEVTKEYDRYATELRKLDASIQKANWEFSLDYTEGRKIEEPKKAKK